MTIDCHMIITYGTTYTTTLVDVIINNSKTSTSITTSSKEIYSFRYGLAYVNRATLAIVSSNTGAYNGNMYNNRYSTSYMWPYLLNFQDQLL